MLQIPVRKSNGTRNLLRKLLKFQYTTQGCPLIQRIPVCSAPFATVLKSFWIQTEKAKIAQKQPNFAILMALSLIRRSLVLHSLPSPLEELIETARSRRGITTVQLPFYINSQWLWSTPSMVKHFRGNAIQMSLKIATFSELSCQVGNSANFKVLCSAVSIVFQLPKQNIKVWGQQWRLS